MTLLLLALIPLLVFAIRWWIKRPEVFGLGNIYTEGQHDKGWMSLFPDEDIPVGSDGAHLYLFGANSEIVGNVAIAGINDIPIGVIGDTTVIGSQAGYGGSQINDISMPVVVRLLGSSGSGTQLVSVNSTVARGDFLVPDANGYARTLPTAPGTYWVCGRALSAGEAVSNVEFDPCLPYPVVVS